MAHPLSRQELVDEVRTALVQICRRAVSEGSVARVEGLIGITLANKNVFLVNIHEDFIDSKQIRSTNPGDDHTSDDCGMEKSRNLCVDDGSVAPKLSQKMNRSSVPQKEASKLDMLMRYSNNLFDQFKSNSSCRRQKAMDCAPSREQQGTGPRQQQQLHLSDEQPNDIRCPKELQLEATAIESEFSYSDQSFNTKDDQNCSGVPEKASLRSYLSDRLATGSSKSSGSQCQQDDGGDGEETNQASMTPGRIPGYEFLLQPPWVGPSFETYGAPNDFGENSESRPYVCELCDASFSKKFCLANHIVTVHQVGGKYVCTHCGKQFLQKLRYMTHVDRHNNIRRHVCQLCGKAFSYKYSLWSHAKKCVGSVPGLDENMFSTLQPDPSFPARVGPTVSNQTVDDEEDVSSEDAADPATDGK